MRLSLFVSMLLIIVSSNLANSGDGTMARARAGAWWLGSYPQLLEALSSRETKSWGVAIGEPDAAPDEKGEATLLIERGDSLLLVSTYKQPAINLKTRLPLPGVYIDVVMKIRDTDADGLPDEFRGEPFDPNPGEIVVDGFIQIRDHEDHSAILTQWDALVGLATKTLVRADN